MTNADMETHIRDYFAACNAGDPEKIAAYFEPDGVHYFPPGMYGGAFRGARTIGERWKSAVETIGSFWTIDRLLCDASSNQAVLEWTHFKRKQNVLLRGDEWYIFSERGLIREIRAYYASPQDLTRERLELDGFDYEKRGYPIASPVELPKP